MRCVRLKPRLCGVAVKNHSSRLSSGGKKDKVTVWKDVVKVLPRTVCHCPIHLSESAMEKLLSDRLHKAFSFREAWACDAMVKTLTSLNFRRATSGLRTWAAKVHICSGLLSPSSSKAAIKLVIWGIRLSNMKHEFLGHAYVTCARHYGKHGRTMACLKSYERALKFMALEGPKLTLQSTVSLSTMSTMSLNDIVGEYLEHLKRLSNPKPRVRQVIRWSAMTAPSDATLVPTEVRQIFDQCRTFLGKKDPASWYRFVLGELSSQPHVKVVMLIELAHAWLEEGHPNRMNLVRVYAEAGALLYSLATEADRTYNSAHARELWAAYAQVLIELASAVERDESATALLLYQRGVAVLRHCGRDCEGLALRVHLVQLLLSSGRLDEAACVLAESERLKQKEVPQQIPFLPRSKFTEVISRVPTVGKFDSLELSALKIQLLDFAGISAEVVESLYRILMYSVRSRPLNDIQCLGYQWNCAIFFALNRFVKILRRPTDAAEAFEVCRLFGDHHPEIAKLTLHIARAYLFEGKLTEAKFHLQEAAKCQIERPERILLLRSFWYFCDLSRIVVGGSLSCWDALVHLHPHSVLWSLSYFARCEPLQLKAFHRSVAILALLQSEVAIVLEKVHRKPRDKPTVWQEVLCLAYWFASTSSRKIGATGPALEYATEACKLLNARAETFVREAVAFGLALAQLQNNETPAVVEDGLCNLVPRHRGMWQPASSQGMLYLLSYLQHTSQHTAAAVIARHLLYDLPPLPPRVQIALDAIGHNVPILTPTLYYGIALTGQPLNPADATTLELRRRAARAPDRKWMLATIRQLLCHNLLEDADSLFRILLARSPFDHEVRQIYAVILHQKFQKPNDARRQWLILLRNTGMELSIFEFSAFIARAYPSRLCSAEGLHHTALSEDYFDDYAKRNNYACLLAERVGSYQEALRQAFLASRNSKSSGSVMALNVMGTLILAARESSGSRKKALLEVVETVGRHVLEIISGAEPISTTRTKELKGLLERRMAELCGHQGRCAEGLVWLFRSSQSCAHNMKYVAVALARFIRQEDIDNSEIIGHCIQLLDDYMLSHPNDLLVTEEYFVMLQRFRPTDPQTMWMHRYLEYLRSTTTEELDVGSPEELGDHSDPDEDG